MDLSKERRSCAIRPIHAYYVEMVKLGWDLQRIEDEVNRFTAPTLTWAGIHTGVAEFQKSEEWKAYLRERDGPTH